MGDAFSKSLSIYCIAFHMDIYSFARNPALGQREDQTQVHPVCSAALRIIVILTDVGTQVS